MIARAIVQFPPPPPLFLHHRPHFLSEIYRCADTKEEAFVCFNYILVEEASGRPRFDQAHRPSPTGVLHVVVGRQSHTKSQSAVTPYRYLYRYASVLPADGLCNSGHCYARWRERAGRVSGRRQQIFLLCVQSPGRIGAKYRKRLITPFDIIESTPFGGGGGGGGGGREDLTDLISRTLHYTSSSRV